MNRKKFLQLSSLGLSSLGLSSFVKSSTQKPIVVSTWDSGKEVNAAAWKILSANGRSLDAVEAGAIYIENQQNCCVGLGGYPDRDGVVTLDACIMDEHANCGAVAALEQIKHPVSVARRIMETTPHVLLAGHGAQQFALENGFAKEPATLSEEAAAAYKQWLQKSEYKPIINIEKTNKGNGPFAPAYFDDGSANHDTMGLIAMDAAGNLSGAVTTSGMAYKIHGRVGDSPIIGAGLFVDNEIGAAASTGVGEEVIRIAGTHLVVEFMRQGFSPEMACKKAVERVIKRNRAKAKEMQVAFIAINKKGTYGAYSMVDGFEFCVRSGSVDQLYKSKHVL